jgi:sarcosine oxidase delta subunit
MVGEYVLSSAHNSGLTPEFAPSFCPSYFAAQEASVALRVSATRHVIQIDGLASPSNPITKARGARAVMPQSFCPFNMEEECTLLARGEETTTPQAARASNSRVPEYVYIKKTHNFPLISLWNANFKCMKWLKSLCDALPSHGVKPT